MAVLYLVGTPIGNSTDIAYGAVDVLKRVNVITCEDTRVISKLCSHYDIPTPLGLYHEHNKDKQTAFIIEQLELGLDVTFVSDTGLPLISDPGYKLVVTTKGADIKIETVPEPNAGLTVLMASGLPSYVYTSLGFLPRKEKEKSAVLERRMHGSNMLIIYEPPHRVTGTLKTIAKIDATQRVPLGRELARKFGQIVTDDVTQLQALTQQGDIPLKDEFVILVEGAEANNEISWFDDLSINEHIDHYVQTSQMKPKQAIREAAEERQLKTNEVYNIYHQVS